MGFAFLFAAAAALLQAGAQIGGPVQGTPGTGVMAIAVSVLPMTRGTDTVGSGWSAARAASYRAANRPTSTVPGAYSLT